MVQLKPGTSAQSALAALDETVRTAGNLLGSGKVPIDRVNEYRPWSTRQIRALSHHLTAASVESIIATRRYWALQSIEPVAYGLPALAELVDLELNECIEACEAAITALRRQVGAWNLWGVRKEGQPGHPAVILDTNVLLLHTATLLDIDWHAGLGIRSTAPIGLGVPMTVVEELDRLKLATGEWTIGGKKQSRRTYARRALNWLDATFPGDAFSVELREGDGVTNSDVFAVLLVDDMRRERLSRPDLDVLDDALQLQPLVERVAVATYDKAMIFRARSLDLLAFAPGADPRT